jgi:hypothetical protein
MSSPCLICGQATVAHGQAKIRHLHEGRFRRCESCGFVFIENVNWLPEAYAEAIDASDTGYVARNLACRDRARMFIELFLDPAGEFLDYAAGYGLFVRMMRDFGYDFRWADLYCENLFARGFEEPLPLKGPFEAVTAFEVLEHMVDPLQEIAKLAAATQCLIFTTTLLPQSTPAPADWWYYGLDHGQHVSFYTIESLEIVARRFGFHLASDGLGFHVFSRQPISAPRFQHMDNRWWKLWIGRTRRRQSRIWSDHQDIRNRLFKAGEQAGSHA